MCAKHLSTTRRDILKCAGGAFTLATLTTALPSTVNATAPMLGVRRPTIYRFKLGTFEVTNILDGFIQRRVHPIQGSNQDASVVEKLANANGLPFAWLDHHFVNTLVNTGKELVLFDTGNGRGRLPTAGNLATLLATAGYRPEEIDVVVITHGHSDHIGGLIEDGRPVYPNARYVFGEVEFDFWRRGENVREARKANRELFIKMALPLAEKATFVKNEGEVVSGIRAVSTFGHSPGHMSYHIESNGQRLLIWGDTASHYVFSIQRPDWHGEFDDDKEAAAATRKRIFDMVAKDKLAVVGYHMPFPSLGFIETFGATHRWVPASYQFNL